MSKVSEGWSLFYCANYSVVCDKLIAHRISESLFPTLIALMLLRCHINNCQWMGPLLDSYIVTFMPKEAVETQHWSQILQNIAGRGAAVLQKLFWIEMPKLTPSFHLVVCTKHLFLTAEKNIASFKASWLGKPFWEENILRTETNIVWRFAYNWKIEEVLRKISVTHQRMLLETPTTFF